MMTPIRRGISICVTLLWCLPLTLADPPPGYYATVDVTNSTTLRATLHAVIDDHERVPQHSFILDRLGGI